MKVRKLELGDTIGVLAPSGPIIGKKINEVERAKEIVEKVGFKVEFSKNLFSCTNGYSATAKEKADDINEMFKNSNIKMIWCAKGGANSNTTFDYIDFDLLKENPKIICGYSDITSITNIITDRTGMITFSGTNFKTIATDETDFSFKEVLKRFVDEDISLGKAEDYTVLKEGIAEGKLIGGNLSLTNNLVSGKYSIDFNDKILFLEELGAESDPEFVSNFLYNMKQNGVFDKINGLWIGNYNHESNVSLEKIVLDVLENEYKFPIIKSDNFGHIENKIVIPVGAMARIDTTSKEKIKLLENVVY
jgi:muramoyltetrapeptide carboxypeptidase